MTPSLLDLRRGTDGIDSPVILGLWPMAGITSEIVDRETNLATIRAAIDAGITAFDTAYSYGYDGECDRLLGTVVAESPGPLAVIGKVAQRWTEDRQRVVDASPRQLIADAEQSLRRIGIETFDLLMLHSVDPAVDVRRSAEALLSLRDRGLAKSLGICNAGVADLQRFAEVHLPSAIQVPLNILQPEVLSTVVPWCRQQNVQVHVYWALMKGILAGQITRDHQFGTGDSRPKYDIYQGQARQRTHQLVDSLTAIGARTGYTVAQLSIGWALAQPGITSALVGAKHPRQISETAASLPLRVEIIREIDGAVERLHV